MRTLHVHKKSVRDYLRRACRLVDLSPPLWIPNARLVRQGNDDCGLLRHGLAKTERDLRELVRYRRRVVQNKAQIANRKVLEWQHQWPR